MPKTPETQSHPIEQTEHDPLEFTPDMDEEQRALTLCRIYRPLGATVFVPVYWAVDKVDKELKNVYDIARNVLTQEGTIDEKEFSEENKHRIFGNH